MADYIEPAEEDIKKASSLAVLMAVGVVLSLVVITFLIWILYTDALASDEFFGGTMIIILWYLSQIFIIGAVILLFMRSAYGMIRILLIINIFTGLASLGVATIFSIIGLIKLSKARSAFPLELEKDKRQMDAEVKISGQKVRKLELECPECSKDFTIKDTGKRPLPIKCPHCGVAGEI